MSNVQRKVFMHALLALLRRKQQLGHEGYQVREGVGWVPPDLGWVPPDLHLTHS